MKKEAPKLVSCVGSQYANDAGNRSIGRNLLPSFAHANATMILARAFCRRNSLPIEALSRVPISSVTETNTDVLRIGNGEGGYLSGMIGRVAAVECAAENFKPITLNHSRGFLN